MITVNIDVTKIDENRFFKGKKGTYMELILIETPNGQYGDFMVKQATTKEERGQKVDLPILGNAKYVGKGQSQQPQRQQPRQAPRKSWSKPADNFQDTSDIPY